MSIMLFLTDLTHHIIKVNLISERLDTSRMEALSALQIYEMKQIGEDIEGSVVAVSDEIAEFREELPDLEV